MNKEMFWQLIDESREACRDNIKDMAKYLEGLTLKDMLEGEGAL